METIQQVAAKITKAIPTAKRGTLRIWGEWFGRPHDNYHRLVACEATGDFLRLRFDESEILSIRKPFGVEISATTFHVASAEAIRWTWFYYGRTKMPENLRYREYVVQPDGTVAFTTDFELGVGSEILPQGTISSFVAMEIL